MPIVVDSNPIHEHGSRKRCRDIGARSTGATRGGTPSGRGTSTTGRRGSIASFGCEPTSDRKVQQEKVFLMKLFPISTVDFFGRTHRTGNVHSPNLISVHKGSHVIGRPLELVDMKCKIEIFRKLSPGRVSRITVFMFPMSASNHSAVDSA
jgi:hypothetical protein